jgi:hypothetical protein
MHCGHARGGGGACLLDRMEIEVLRDLKRSPTDRRLPDTVVYNRARRSLLDHEYVAWHRHRPGYASLHDYLVLTPAGETALAACAPQIARAGGGAVAGRRRTIHVRGCTVAAHAREVKTKSRARRGAASTSGGGGSKARVIRDPIGRIPWVCRSCGAEMWTGAHSAGFGCRTCGSGHVETHLDGVGWVGPTDHRLAAALAEEPRRR